MPAAMSAEPGDQAALELFCVTAVTLRIASTGHKRRELRLHRGGRLGWC